ncbi:DNA recombination protein RmuC [Spiroplasma endosymbiont of Labia minor]|uniref:DNA recombination protein RmuC n=1 Tax=Spiroplasma endosymbiont of Labia minor TaxID=3066305 RepID=UPI0030D1527A
MLYGIFAVVTVLVILAIVILILQLKKKADNSTDTTTKSDLNSLKMELTQNSSNVKNDVINQLLTLRTESNEKINSVETQVKDYITTQLNDTQNKFNLSSNEIRNKIDDVSQKTVFIDNIKHKLDKLDNLLSQNNKAGKAGEYTLERMMANIAGNFKGKNLLFETQYTMQKTIDSKSLRPDLFIKGNGDKFINIPIDAKMPFKEYLKLIEINEENNPDDYKNHKKAFETDVKKRIDETAKYVSAEDNVVYSIMFVPSESIFSFIIGQTDLIDMAFKKKVIIAGPTTLITIIESIDKYMSLFDNINNYEKKVEILDKTIKYLDNFNVELFNLETKFIALYNQFKEINTKEKSLKKQYDKLLKENED